VLHNVSSRSTGGLMFFVALFDSKDVAINVATTKYSISTVTIYFIGKVEE